MRVTVIRMYHPCVDVRLWQCAAADLRDLLQTKTSHLLLNLIQFIIPIAPNTTPHMEGADTSSNYDKITRTALTALNPSYTPSISAKTVNTQRRSVITLGLWHEYNSIYCCFVRIYSRWVRVDFILSIQHGSFLYLIFFKEWCPRGYGFSCTIGHLNVCELGACQKLQNRTESQSFSCTVRDGHYLTDNEHVFR